MKTPTSIKIFRSISLLISLIMLVSLAFSHPAITALASDGAGVLVSSSPPGEEPAPTNTPLPYFTPTPSVTPTPTVTYTPTPTGSVTPTPTFTPTPELVGPPDIAITPTSFDISLNQGEISTETLTIMNTGRSDLAFSITASGDSASIFHTLQFPSDKIEPGLTDIIRSSADQKAIFLVYLTTQADLASAFQIQEWDSRGDAVFHLLQDTAQ